MQNFVKSMLCVLCLTATFLTGGAIVSNAQTTVENTKSVKNVFSEIVRAKGRNNPFVLLTPDDLSKFSPTELAALVSSADPCEMAAPIGYNQNVNGQLTNADCRLDDGSYADFYAFNGTAGQNIRISMNSAVFDTYLGISNESGTFVLEDDDSGGGTHSLIITSLPAAGLYVILANSAFANQFGDYTLRLDTECTYSLNPMSATIPAEGGTFTFAVETQTGCQWAAQPDSGNFLSSSSTGIGPGIATYTATPNGFNGTRTGTLLVGGGKSFTVTQPPLTCTFSLSPSSVTVPATGITDTFTVNTQPNCNWTAQSNGFGISASATGSGTGTVTYMLTTNNGADRVRTITAAGQTFTVNQPGLNCTFSATPTNISVDRFDNYGTINIITQPGCLWTAGGASPWILLDTLTGTGSGVINYRITFNQYPAPRTGLIPIYGLDYIRVNVMQSGVSTRTNFDYDFDGKADISVYRPSNGVWYLNQSQKGFTGFQFGSPTDKIVPGDYDGDGKTDLAVFREGNWYIQRSQLGFKAIAFGDANDIPVPADYDLDGKTDIAVWRPSNGTWYIYSLFNNNLLLNPVQFGTDTDKPLVGDYDGDGKADFAVYRPSNGTWYLLQSRNGFTGIQFGDLNDKPVPADYDGDGKTDIAVFRPSNGTWYRLNSSNGQFVGMQFGISADLPVAADYDGDGKADISVYRNGVWYLNQTTAGFTGVAFGSDTDKPVPNAFVR